MLHPEYRYIHKSMKCPKKRVNIYSTSTYKYNPEKDMYQLIERTCDAKQRQNKSFSCNGLDDYNLPCIIINPPCLELSPDCPEFD